MNRYVRIRTDQPFIGCKPQPDSIKDIDWNDRSDRKWLDSHLHWAMCNGRTCIIYPTPRNEPLQLSESNSTH